MTSITIPNNSTRSIGARKAKRFSLRPRDLEILEAVYAHRVLTTAQISALFFPTADSSVSSACRTRLRYLSDARLLEAAEQLQTRSEGRRPLLFMPSAQGCQLLVDELDYEPDDIDWKPAYNSVRWPFLAHQLAINEVFVTATLAAKRLGWSLESWVDDRFLRKRHTKRVKVYIDDYVEEIAVVPDAYFEIKNDDGRFRFFLEVDRATMAVSPAGRHTKSWQRRIHAYQALFDESILNDLYGTTSIRILTVTTGNRRLQSLKKAIEAAGGMKRYWLTTMELLAPDTAFNAPIWHVASVAGERALLA